MTAPLRRLFIRDLSVMARIGVYPEEHIAPQPVLISIDGWVADDPVTLDRIDQVLSYELFRNAALEVIKSGHIALVETMAQHIADIIMRDDRVARLRIRIEKTAIFHDAAAVGVELERTR